MASLFDKKLSAASTKGAFETWKNILDPENRFSEKLGSTRCAGTS